MGVQGGDRAACGFSELVASRSVLAGSGVPEGGSPRLRRSRWCLSLFCRRAKVLSRWRLQLPRVRSTRDWRRNLQSYGAYNTHAPSSISQPVRRLTTGVLKVSPCRALPFPVGAARPLASSARAAMPTPCHMGSGSLSRGVKHQNLSHRGFGQSSGLGPLRPIGHSTGPCSRSSYVRPGKVADAHRVSQPEHRRANRPTAHWPWPLLAKIGHPGKSTFPP